MSKWVGIQEFVTTVELRSISKAADILGITKSSISKRITALESRLGTLLIHRSNRAISLTAEGEIYFENSRQLLKQLDNNDERLLERHGELQGRINISLPPGTGESLLLPLIAQFKRKHEKVEFNLHFSTRRADIAKEGFDLALRLAKVIEPNVVAKKLWTRPYHLCATQEFLKTTTIPSHPLDLQTVNCLVYSEFIQGSGGMWRFEEEDSKEKITVAPKAAISSNSVSSLVAACLQNSGLVYCSEFFVHQFIAQGALISLMQNWISEEQTLWTVFPDRNALTRRARAFIDFLDNWSLDN